eukprot:CAMPEP_0203859244 /NCGR_PEP_ID=MMETSP0359-20131031/11726_1 /ASSEMBLY_ACC=CAM_ASM_000338 /TAXON_ID=268821 /ORGANISM="Scrippsiella Hangoei, Strain SHTV-5" /LENGTH=73 /DNA_ID=CAMNT_0050776113 /DNA_START=315 /DNA_END=536 /DNA_ORIENTATION=-
MSTSSKSHQELSDNSVICGSSRSWALLMFLFASRSHGNGNATPSACCTSVPPENADESLDGKLLLFIRELVWE